MNDADLRQLWTEVSSRLDERELPLRAEQEARRNRAAARSAWPGIAGQVGQIAFGALTVFLVAGLWSTLPTDPLVFLCGVLLHLYGAAIVACAVRAIGLIRAIDYDKPLLDGQLSLARAEKALVLSRLVAGQPWWFLWIAVAVVLLGAAGVPFAGGGAVTLTMLGLSVLGMVATLALRALMIRRGIVDPIGRQLAGARARLQEIGRAASI